MNANNNLLARALKLDRLVHLRARLCLESFVWEVVFAVGTRGGSSVPNIYLEMLNLVFQPSEELGGGEETPSASLPGGSTPEVRYNSQTGEIECEFEINIHLPAAHRQEEEKYDPENHVLGSMAVPTKARLSGRFLDELKPREYGYQNLKANLSIAMPDQYIEQLGLRRTFDLDVLLPLVWLFLAMRKELLLQPVFIAADGAKPPTGEDFYPLLVNANDLWAKCCIQFRAKCPVYVDKQGYRISTQAEATAFKDEVSVADAIEVFMVERLDPETTWGGGATFNSGTASAKIVTGDNQLPVNQYHLAHELGHVLGLDHPGNPGGLIDGCAGSVMEPSGFFADNPPFQCRNNCNNASNPLLTTIPYHWCFMVNRPGDELF